MRVPMILFVAIGLIASWHSVVVAGVSLEPGMISAADVEQTDDKKEEREDNGNEEQDCD